MTMQESPRKRGLSAFRSPPLHPHPQFMHHRTVVWAAALIFLAVAAGAFGAHGLRAQLSTEAMVQWRTAVEYQFYHGLGMLLLVALSIPLPSIPVKGIARLFLVGVALFSGSIYLLSTRGLTGWEWAGPFLGPITPIGGLLLMGGWAWLFLAALQRTDHR